MQVANQLGTGSLRAAQAASGTLAAGVLEVLIGAIDHHTLRKREADVYPPTSDHPPAVAAEVTPRPGHEGLSGQHPGGCRPLVERRGCDVLGPLRLPSLALGEG